MEDSTFTDNNATNGGAIFVYTPNATISNSFFDNNYAKYFGGAVYYQGDKCTLKNSFLNNNKAVYYGGAVFWMGANKTI